MIYFVQARNKPDSPIKIGYTADHLLPSRLGALRNASPEDLHVLATMAGSEEEEAALHRRFDGSRVVREWFDPSDELHALIVEAQDAAWEPAARPKHEPVVYESHLHSAAASLQRILAAKDPSKVWLVEVKEETP